MKKALLALSALLFLGVTMKRASLPRGIRNNNPGNIRENRLVDYDWQGEHPLNLDPEFEEFKSPFYGLRAMGRVLRNYRALHGLMTIRGIISRWAPSNENDTAAYIEHVSRELATPPDMPLLPGQYPALMAVIVQHENGQQPYEMAMIETAWTAANA
ncbi:hypothetical protein [Ferrimonas balearica]|uniref:hypothetical protein n=1 Tax=Ferrimonas balearica TaxID=44012 RepID=UPI001F3D0FA4|nr:hypothetical protein [Ferrimonas balearica]MBY6095122.1 hypothetical protein [Ferrimonas balearica]